MSSQFYTVTMGFMILAAVPVLAIKYHNSHGATNKVNAKSHPDYSTGAKADAAAAKTEAAATKERPDAVSKMIKATTNTKSQEGISRTTTANNRTPVVQTTAQSTNQIRTSGLQRSTGMTTGTRQQSTYSQSNYQAHSKSR